MYRGRVGWALTIRKRWQESGPRMRLASCYLPVVVALLLAPHLPGMLPGLLVAVSVSIIPNGVRALFRTDFDRSQVDMVTLAAALAALVGVLPSGNLLVAVVVALPLAGVSRIVAIITLSDRYRVLPPPPATRPPA